MAKTHQNPDVLVLGEHPSAYLAAALMKHNSKLQVMHSIIPGEQYCAERLVLLNPELFDLHEILKPVARKIDCKPIYGLQFLSDNAATKSEHRNKSAMVSVAVYRDVREAFKAAALKQEVDLVAPRQVKIHRLDEGGIEVNVGNELLRPKALMLAGRLAPDQERMLGLPDSWERGVLHRYTFIKLKPTALDLGNRPIVPMSLDLGGILSWAWVLPGKKYVQLAVEQPLETIAEHPPETLMAHWVAALRKHGLLASDTRVSVDSGESMDLPFAGALAHEGIANRTMLIGPAGGFYSASGEDIYPNCWSAVFAVDILKRALKETHLQDALRAFSHKWRTTLGEYLRGPQQNLRFLLPLVYRNQVMTSRLAESILLGKSVVR